MQVCKTILKERTALKSRRSAESKAALARYFLEKICMSMLCTFFRVRPKMKLFRNVLVDFLQWTIDSG